MFIYIYGCFGGQKRKWTAFIYPNKMILKKYKKSPITFISLDECKKPQYLKLKSKSWKYCIFKCGLNCNYHEGMKLEFVNKC